MPGAFVNLDIEGDRVGLSRIIIRAMKLGLRLAGFHLITIVLAAAPVGQAMDRWRRRRRRRRRRSLVVNLRTVEIEGGVGSFCPKKVVRR